MHKSELWYLENVNLFQAFCPTKLGMFHQQHSSKRYKKDDFIFFSDDAAETICLIAEGKVKIFTYMPDGTEVVHAYLGKGEIFGEMAMLGETKRTYFAQAAGNETEICSMTRETMMNLMLNNTEFQLKIYKLIGWRIRKLERRISLLLQKNVRQRLLEFVEELAAESGMAENGCIVIRHTLTQRNIADLIGTTRQTLNQLLHELHHEGVLSADRKTIVMKNTALVKKFQVSAI
ncbi:MAG: Crp/Fnr family transcriptional regulator [Candidatus Kapabacteria bacterium]|nr:Crp/Fnr family transcriptional regulator [Candidatus Kapabacteria bacterium]